VAVRRFDNFANQRNVALHLAGGDWVLFVDADERPTRQLAREIRRRTAACREHGFRVPIRSSIFGRRFRFSGTQDDRPVRLVRRNSGRWMGRVHEVLRCRGRVGQMRNWLEHTTLPDLPTFLAKMERYTTLEAEVRVATGRRPTWRDAWLVPSREVYRRLVWKQGWLDGPRGWAFCLLSGWSEWVLADKHLRLWDRHSCLSKRDRQECLSHKVVFGKPLSH
jgi:glycosyltransferase involved in cell wall biosynthesis